MSRHTKSAPMIASCTPDGARATTEMAVEKLVAEIDQLISASRQKKIGELESLVQREKSLNEEKARFKKSLKPFIEQFAQTTAASISWPRARPKSKTKMAQEYHPSVLANESELNSIEAKKTSIVEQLYTLIESKDSLDDTLKPWLSGIVKTLFQCGDVAEMDVWKELERSTEKELTMEQILMSSPSPTALDEANQERADMEDLSLLHLMTGVVEMWTNTEDNSVASKFSSGSGAGSSMAAPPPPASRRGGTATTSRKEAFPKQKMDAGPTFFDRLESVLSESK